MTVNVALVGLGYWGPNLARSLAATRGAHLRSLCDLSFDRLEQYSARYPGVRLERDVEGILADPDVHAVVVATPADSHFAIAAAALRAGKHVLVEKPLARTSDQARQLIALAEAGRRILMAGHVFLYNAAVRRVKEYIDSGLLGRVYYVYSQRLNLGIIRRDVNALWNFAPHDLSILNYWLGSPPLGVVARGFCYVQPGIEDVVFMTLDYPGGVGSNVHISWLDPHKIRRMTVVGSEKMVVYDDSSPDARVVIYDKGVTRTAIQSNSPPSSSIGRFDDFGEFQLLVRAGDVLIPKLDFPEPLKVECQHFIDCIQNDKPPMTDGRAGLHVVETLEAAERSLAAQGMRIPVTTST